MALFYAAIWRDSVSLLRFPFLSHVIIIIIIIIIIISSLNGYYCFEIEKPDSGVKYGML